MRILEREGRGEWVEHSWTWPSRILEDLKGGLDFPPFSLLSREIDARGKEVRILGFFFFYSIHPHPPRLKVVGNKGLGARIYSTKGRRKDSAPRLNPVLRVSEGTGPCLVLTETLTRSVKGCERLNWRWLTEREEWNTGCDPFLRDLYTSVYTISTSISRWKNFTTPLKEILPFWKNAS